MPLTLRPTGLSSPAYADKLDYVVCEDGKVIGRLYEDVTRSPIFVGSGPSRCTSTPSSGRAGKAPTEWVSVFQREGGMRIYLAGPLFTTAERDFNAALAAGLRALGHEVWVPQESEQQQTTAKAIFDSDVRGIDWCEVVVACMDGTDPDSGTCWEVGSVWQRKPTVLYRTDIRCESLPLGPYKDDALLKALKAEPVLHADETSWWVARSGFSLWVLTNGAGTCYRVVASRSRAQAEALLGDYQGVLVSDCLNIYDDLTPHQHKCYAHHLKAISKALEDPTARASGYLPDLRALLQGAMALKAVMTALPPAQVALARQSLETSADRLLNSPRTVANAGEAAPGEEKVRERLRKQRDHLFTFLDHPGVDATNNFAERQLRPAVISRKLSCGNKTEHGARTWEILASFAATCRQTGCSFVDFLVPRLILAPSQARAATSR